MGKTGKYLVAFCLTCMVTVLFQGWFGQMNQNLPIDHLEIDQRSVHLLVGERLQLTVTGYAVGGAPVSQERLEKLDIKWIGTRPEAFSVSEDGLLTGLSNAYGSGYVFVTTENEELSTLPVTVTIYKWETPVVVEDQ